MGSQSSPNTNKMQLTQQQNWQLQHMLLQINADTQTTSTARECLDTGFEFSHVIDMLADLADESLAGDFTVMFDRNGKPVTRLQLNAIKTRMINTIKIVGGCAVVGVVALIVNILF